MVANVSGYAPFCDDVRELLDAFQDPAQRRTTSNVPIRTFQVDGQPSDNADGGRENAILGISMRRPWSRHRGLWATFEKLKEKYWWSGMY